MKNKNKIVALSVSVCILISLIIPLALPMVSYANEETIYINNADEFIEIAKKCSYDAWSIGKTIALGADISLEGIDFEPVPSFSGTFDGNGHTISGIDLNGAYSPAGLFSTLEKDGVITNLKVEGAITPDGDKGLVGGIVGINSGKIEGCSFNGTVIGSSDVGGIAGINRVSGSITDCKVNGEIIGENRTGGIAGTNEGIISSCENSAKVNTIGITPTVSLDEINISLTLDITKLPSLNNSTMSDTGGISGYTTGIIIGCTNLGQVGYPHIGYNVGGIAGRSQGHLANNLNGAEIYGRKDVGGIVGQIDPYISYELSEDLLAALKSELDRLGGEVDGALNSSDANIPGISNRLDTILTNIDLATDSLNKIINGTTDFGNDLTGEVNRFSLILTEVMAQMSGITEDLPELSTMLGNAMSELESALKNLESFSSVSAGALNDVATALKDASDSFGAISNGINSINEGLGRLEGAITVNDKDEAKEAVDLIADELNLLVTAIDDFTNAFKSTTEILNDTPWAEKALKNLTDLVEIFDDITNAVSVIYDATLVIREDVDINWEKIQQSGDEMLTMIGHFSDMAEALSGAIDLLDSGFEQITGGFEMLANAVSVNDLEAAAKAIEDIGIGFDKIIAGGSAAGEALGEISELMAELDGGADLSEVISSASVALESVGKAITQMTEGLSIAWDGISALLDEININFDSISGGFSLIVGGMGDVDASFDELKQAAKSMSDGIQALERAVTAISEAVIIEDEDKLSSALNSAYDALGDIVGAMTEMSSVFGEITDTLALVMAWSEDLTTSIDAIADAMTKMSGALVNIQSGVDSLRKNISFDLDGAKEGLTLIRDGLSDMANASEYLKSCLSHLSDAVTKVDGGSEYLNGFVTDIKEFIAIINGGTEMITDISENINSIVSYLKGIDPIQLPTLPNSVTEEADQLFIYINNIESELKLLTKDITSLSEEMTATIGNINEIFNAMSDNIVDMIYGLNDGKIVDNRVSEEEIHSVTNGKLFSCINNGRVQGDINVGGIGGAMGIEYALDPEDDLSIELTVTQKKQYKLKAIVHSCVNYGEVISKRDCAGGIVGKMDLGLIYGSEAYCSVESLSGNYVGGIAGITAGLVSGCFAKATLYGNKYVGGIVGSGVSEDFSGDSSMVRGCYSMVEVRRSTQYAGAISGINAGEFNENMFVSNTLAGIDRISYVGKAEPISYEDLIKRRTIADGFYSFTVKFVVDGNVIFSTSISYGGDVDSSLIPEIPVKEGYYSYWDKTDLTDLVFDTEVNAVYKPYITTVESEEKRDDRPIFFVQGEFTEGNGITLESGCDTLGLVLSDKLFTNDKLVEGWILTIPQDALDENNVHFLPKNDNTRIFLKINGAWQQVDAKEFGSYLSFDVTGDKVEIAVVEHTIKLVPVIIAVSIALVILASVIVVIVVLKKAKSKEKK